jgi:hypothetical protein
VVVKEQLDRSGLGAALVKNTRYGEKHHMPGYDDLFEEV